MVRKPHTLKQFLLVVVLAVAFVASGLSHRMPSPDDVALQSFILAGGDVADLCVDADGDGLTAQMDCPACHIKTAADLPKMEQVVRIADLVFVAKVVAPCESRALRMVLDPARGLRAPPLV